MFFLNEKIKHCQKAWTTLHLVDDHGRQHFAGGRSTHHDGGGML